MLRKFFNRKGGRGDRPPCDKSNEAFVYEAKNRVTGETEFNLSFLPHDLVFDKGLPDVAILGRLTDGPENLDAEHFIPNDSFIRFFHQFTARNMGDCPDLIGMARRQGSGTMYMIDPRTPTPHGEVPAEDILGAVMVQNGNMVEYRGNPNFQLFTDNGLMFLSPWWRERFVEEIKGILGVDA